MTTHILKTWPEPFEAAASGAKLHEIRVNDRAFAVGDVLHLAEWSPAAAAFTGRFFDVSVTYLTGGGEWGLPDALCVMSIRPVAKSPF